MREWPKSDSLISVNVPCPLLLAINPHSTCVANCITSFAVRTSFSPFFVSVNFGTYVPKGWSIQLVYLVRSNAKWKTILTSLLCGICLWLYLIVKFLIFCNFFNKYKTNSRIELAIWTFIISISLVLWLSLYFYSKMKLLILQYYYGL